MLKNRLLYLAVLAACLLFVYLYDGEIVYITLYSVLMLPVLSFATAFVSRWALEITQSIDRATVTKGEEAHYRLNVRNKFIFAFTNISFALFSGNIAVQADTRTMRLRLGPLAAADVPIALRCVYRGTYDVGIKYVEIYDFLGLFRFIQPVNANISLTVCPRVMDVQNLVLAQNFLSQARSNFAVIKEDDLMDVRKYEPTDSYKRIHWKLSAKKNDLVVKNFQSSALNATVILLDTRGTAGAKHDEDIIREDKLLEVFVSVANFCIKQQMPVEAVFGAGLRYTALGAAGFEELYAVASGLVFEGEIGPDTLLSDYLSDRYINIIVVSAGLSERLYESVERARQFGHHITLIHVGAAKVADGSQADGEADMTIFNKLVETGAECYWVKADASLRA
jgi:uncharacterized protein (DUF58 family)